MLRAKCREKTIEKQIHPDIFYPEPYLYNEKHKSVGPNILMKQQVKQAKAICAICPVKQECLDYALRNEEVYGIWGGKTTRERAKISKD